MSSVFQENSSLAAPAMPHRLQHLQNSKWLLRGHKMADGVWKGDYHKVFGHSRQNECLLTKERIQKETTKF